MSRSSRLLTFGLALACVSCESAAPDSVPSQGLPDPAQDPAAWLNRPVRVLEEAKTAQGDVTLVVTEGPPAGLFAVGTHRFRFHLAGPHEVHWTESHPGQDKPIEAESWYRGYLLYQRTSQNPEEMNVSPFGEREGSCIAASFAAGGLIGWQVVHRTPMGRLPVPQAVFAGTERLGGRDTVVLKHDLSIKGVCGGRLDSPGCTVWIDRASGLILKRQYQLTLQGMPGGGTLTAVETYENWNLGAPLPEGLFDKAGIEERDPIADLPSDPEAFERIQTEKALGVPVRITGSTAPSAISPDAKPSRFTAFPQAPSGLPLAPDYEKRARVKAQDPQGATYTAFLGYNEGEHILPGHRFVSDRTNRRHLYGNGAYHPEDVYIRKEVGGRLEPTLFFRDVGSHTTAPHALSIDSKGRCHLSVADVDLGSNNRFILYHVVSDPSKTRWESAWQVDRVMEFTESATCASIPRGEGVDLVWSLSGPPTRTGLYHAALGAEGLGPRTRLVDGPRQAFSIFRDPASKALWVAAAGPKDLVVMVLGEDGVWSAPRPVEPGLPEFSSVQLSASPEGGLILRAEGATKRQWRLTSP